MPINVFGNSNSNDNCNKIEFSLFVQKQNLRTNYIEAIIEEDIDLLNQYRIENLADPISFREACSKNYVDNLFNDPSIIKNNALIDFNDKNITNGRFIQVIQWPEIDSHLTAKFYVDNSIDESSLLRLDPDEKLNLEEGDSILLNSALTSPKTIIELPTKSYIDSLHEENERNRKDLGSDFYDESNELVKNNQDNDFNDNKLTNIDSITNNRNPTADNEVSKKNYIGDELDEETIVRFNQTLQNYLKVSVGVDTCNLAKYDKRNITDITEFRNPNTGQILLQKWMLKCLKKSYNAKVNTFLKSTTNTSRTADSGAKSPPSIGRAFMYVETSSNNHGANHVMVFWERSDIIHISNIKFYYNRF